MIKMASEWNSPMFPPKVQKGLKSITEDVLVLEDNGVEQEAFYDYHTGVWVKADGSFSYIQHKVTGWRYLDEE